MIFGKFNFSVLLNANGFLKKTICNGSDSWETMFSTSINFIVNAKARNNVSNQVFRANVNPREKESRSSVCFISFR